MLYDTTLCVYRPRFHPAAPRRPMNKADPQNSATKKQHRRTNATKMPQVNIVETVQAAALDAQRLCETHMGVSPDVVIDSRPGESGCAEAMNVTLPFIEEFLAYILCELLKNSLRATVDFQPRERLGDFPVIVTVTGDEHTASIRVGRPRKSLQDC